MPGPPRYLGLGPVTGVIQIRTDLDRFSLSTTRARVLDVTPHRACNGSCDKSVPTIAGSERSWFDLSNLLALHSTPTAEDPLAADPSLIDPLRLVNDD